MCSIAKVGYIRYTIGRDSLSGKKTNMQKEKDRGLRPILFCLLVILPLFCNHCANDISDYGGNYCGETLNHYRTHGEISNDLAMLPYRRRC